MEKTEREKIKKELEELKEGIRTSAKALADSSYNQAAYILGGMYVICKGLVEKYSETQNTL